jgi:hypothetical protein
MGQVTTNVAKAKLTPVIQNTELAIRDAGRAAIAPAAIATP